MNGFTCIWSGVTWIKYLAENTEFLKIFFNSSLAIFLVIFGVILMIISLLKQEVLFILGNPRITSPLIICFTPVIYGLIIFDALFIVGTVLFLVIGNLIIISIPNLKGKD